MTLPLDQLVVEIAPGGFPDDSATWVWVDVTSYVRQEVGVTVDYGRRDEGPTTETSTLHLTLNNQDGRFSPRNPAGLWYGQLGVNTPIRVRWLSPAGEMFVGFVPEWPSRWNQANTDSWAPIQASGIIRRKQQGQDALHSAIYRSITNRPDVVAYWPMEDREGSTQAASPIPDVAAMDIPSGVEFGSVEGPGGSDQLPRVEVGAGPLLGRVPRHASTNEYTILNVFRMDELPGVGNFRTMQRVRTTGDDVAEIIITASSDTFRVRLRDSDDAIVSTTDETVDADVFGNWVLVALTLTQGASDITWDATVYKAEPGLPVLNNHTGTVASSTFGRVRLVGSTVQALSPERSYGHFTVIRAGADVEQVPLDTDAFHGYTGELAADRFERLCEEEGQHCEVVAPGAALDLTGATSSRASTPDSAALGITGDLDIRCWVAMDDWTPGTFQCFVGKGTTAYRMNMNSADRLELRWREGANDRFAQATVATGFADGTYHWARATLDVDNGASGRTVKFWTSEDGVSWSQLGDPVVQAGVTFISTAGTPLEVGRRGDAAEMLAGRIRYVEVLSGIDGTLVASPNFSLQEPGATSFTDVQGNVWTVNSPASIVADRFDDSMPMGPQRPDTLLNLHREIEATDGGILHEVGGGFGYRTRTDLYNQDVALALTQASGHIAEPPEPTDDDQKIRNDVTAANRSGSSARVVDTVSVQERGRYNEQVEVNAASDSDLEQIAAWRVHDGTVDEMRFPRIELDFARNPGLIDERLALRTGDRLTIDHDLTQLPGVDIDQLVEGWSDRVGRFTWDAVLNCRPASPFRVFEIEHADFGRVHPSRAYLGEDINGTATSFDVVMPVQAPLNSASTFEDPIVVVDNNVAAPFEYRDWAQFGGTFERSTEQMFTGRHSGKFTPDGTTNFPSVSSSRTAGSATPDRSYRADVWLYSPAGGFDVRLDIDFLRSNLSTISGVNGTAFTIGAGTWTRTAVSATAPAETSAVRLVVVYVESPPLTSNILYVDDAEVGVPGAPWVDSVGFASEFPFDISIGGEVMTVTGIGADVSGVQTFTVTRSVNGVTKAHSAGSPVELHPGHVMGL